VTKCIYYHVTRLIAFLKEEAEAAAIEYGLIAAGIAGVTVATANTPGRRNNAPFCRIPTQLQ
jgi:Flp pilus assembly pilin Flp